MNLFIIAIIVVFLVILIVVSIFRGDNSKNQDEPLQFDDEKQNKYYQKSNDQVISKANEQIAKAQKVLPNSDPIKKRILEHYINEQQLRREKQRLDNLMERVGKRENPALNAVIEKCKKDLAEYTKMEADSRFDVFEGLTDRQRDAYNSLLEEFEKLKQCKYLWGTSSDPHNQSVVSRYNASVSLDKFCFLRDNPPVPNISTCYVYPTFIVRSSGEDDVYFKVYPITEVTLKYSKIRFTDTQYRPLDSERVGSKYRHENKDGSPDRRFSDNPRYPVYLYGEMRFWEPGVPLMASNERAASGFVARFHDYANSFRVSNKSTAPNTEPSKDDVEIQNKVRKYIDIKVITKRLLDFFEKLAKDKEFCQEFEKSVPTAMLGDAFQTRELRDLMLILFRNDVIRTYLGLGHGLDLNKKEGDPIVLFICMSMDEVGEAINVTNYEVYLAKMRSNIEGVLRASVSFMKDNDFFVYTEILKDYDRQLLEEYVILLYRFASLVAKVDGTITNEESNWLKSIMALKDAPESIQPSAESQKKEDEGASPNSTPVVKAEDLDKLIGLSSVKEEIHSLSNYVKVQKMRAERGMMVSPISYHCVFTGNPGTGKTTVARIVSSIYKDLGVLQKGHLVETDRSGLVAEYVGQTAVKTNKIIDSALDGILFIDEAYSLVDGGNSDYGKEAISTLLKRMEDDRDRLVVILAGYTNDMKRFIDSNPGLQSRFNRYIEFQDYSAEELFDIFELNANKYEYTLSAAATLLLKDTFNKAVLKKDKNFGNGRYVRNLFEKVIEVQANRLSSVPNVTPETLALIEEEDILNAIQQNTH